ncbi:MAG: MFS transporter [Chloroflexota bacterium]
MHLSWRGANRLLLCSTAISFVAEGHLVAFAPIQLHALGQTDREVAVWSGLLFATTMATSLPLGPFWGVLAERYSRRLIILRSQLLLAVAMFVAAWAPDLAWLVAARALMGLSFGTGGVIAATQVMLTPSRHVGAALAALNASQPIAGSIGPPLGGLLIPYLTLQGLLLIDAILLLASAAVVAWLLPEPTGGHRPDSVLARVVEVMQIVWKEPSIRWSFLCQTVSRGSIATVDTYLPVKISQVAADPATAIGWVLGAYGAMTTAVAWGFTRFAERFDPVRLYTWSMLFGALLAGGIAAAPWLGLVAGLAVLRAFPTAFSRPLLFMHLARVVPAQHQTGVFGLLPTAGNVGSLTLPLLASLTATLGIGAAIATGGVGHAVSAVGGRLLGRSR